QRWHFGRASPKASGPDRTVDLALLEFDPDARAEGRDGDHAGQQPAERHARHGEGRRRIAQNVRHLRLNAALTLRIHIVGAGAAIFSVVLGSVAHLILIRSGRWW